MRPTTHVETTHYTYVDLDSTVRFFRRSRTTARRGKYYRDLGIIVFSAFTIEAYLNHVGASIDPDWHKKERRLDPKSKLELVCKSLGIQISLKSTMYQNFILTFQLRDSLAHGKTTKKKESFSARKRAKLPDVYFGKSQLEKLGQRGKFVETSDSIRTLIKTIHAKFKPGKNPFGISESAEEWNS